MDRMQKPVVLIIDDDPAFLDLCRARLSRYYEVHLAFDGDEGVQMALDLRDEPWGERHFAVTDPNGIPVNVSQLIPPSGEYAQQSSE